MTTAGLEEKAKDLLAACKLLDWVWGAEESSPVDTSSSFSVTWNMRLGKKC
jgi:hypothetical protein